MEVWLSPSRRVASIAPRGELDVADGPRLREALLDVQHARLVVLDLVHVTFVDSTIIGIVVAADRRLRDHGSDLLVLNVSGPPLRAFTALGLGALVMPRQADEGAPALLD